VRKLNKRFVNVRFTKAHSSHGLIILQFVSVIKVYIVCQINPTAS